MIAFMSMTADRDPLDAALRGHLSDRLDGQLGRAEEAFLRHLQNAPAAPPPAYDARGWRIGAWALAASGSLLAASIALFALMPVLRGTGHPAGNPGPTGLTGVARPEGLVASNGGRGEADPGAAPLRVRQVVSRVVDDGTYVIEEKVPVRRYRFQHVEQRLFHDARSGVTVEVTVPSEDVTYVEMPMY